MLVIALTAVLLPAGMVCQPSPVLAGKASAKPAAARKEFVRAVQKNDFKLVEKLIAEGVDVNMSVSGLTPLMLAGTGEMVKLLVREGADVHARSEMLKQSVLAWAASQGNEDVVKALIESGADVNAVDEKTGMTALSTVVMVNRPKITMIKLLIDAGADPNKGQILNMPLLSAAAMSGKTDVMRVLIESGADINAKSAQGATALMTAVAGRKKEAAQLLIDAGADANDHAGEAAGKGAGAGKRGATAMDMAAFTGDSEIMAMLERAGARESEKSPGLDHEKPNPPGLYSLPCSLAGSPPPQGAHFSCSSIDQVAESGVEIAVYSRAYYEGKHLVPLKNRCEADLGQAGRYKIRTTKMETPWELVCRTRLRQTTGAERWIANLERKEPQIDVTESQIVISGSAGKGDREKKEPVRVIIVEPKKDDQFVFDDADPGVLEIDGSAKVLGDCDDAVSWKMEEVGESKMKLDPEGPSNEVTLEFTGLPTESSHFGRKKITASACGKSDEVTVEVFFPTEGENHPGNSGKQDGKTPNWFYYWMRTKAGKVRGMNTEDVNYLAIGSRNCTLEEVQLPDGRRSINFETGLFDPNSSITEIAICNLAAEKSPQVNPLGGKAGFRRREVTGIDAFASAVRHEWQHKLQYNEWWGELHEKYPYDSKHFQGEDSYFASRKRQANYRNFQNAVRESDKDEGTGDSVPDKNEGKGSLRPVNSNRIDTLGVGSDREFLPLKAEYAWKISGSNHKEDWSWCGKQWDDVAECPGQKRW